MSKKVGIFSGSFNPIHNGHIAIARYMVEKEKFDEIWFIVSPQNPLKPQIGLLDDEIRAHMTKLAIENEPTFRYCDIEMHLPRPSYTITTLLTLKKQYTHTELCLLIGSDNWKIFDRWKSHDEIIENYPIYIYPRPGFPVETTILPPTVHLTHAPMMEISSTEIRDLIATGQSTEKYLPLPVHDYIVKHNLYQNPK